MESTDLEVLARQKRAELRRLGRELARLEAMKNKRLKVSSQEVKELAKQIQTLASEHLMETNELLSLIKEAIEKYGKKGSRRGSRGPVPPKYRNPNNPMETWTGRGRQPKWVVEMLSQGYTLEQLKIQDS